jgi:hypothetical protein
MLVRYPVPLVCFAVLLAACSPTAIGSEEVQARLAQPLPAHPRLLLGPEGFDAVRKTIDGDPAMQRVWAFLHAEADALLVTEPVKREMAGKRLLGVSRECLQRVGTLAMAHGITGDARYAQRAEQEMLAAAAFSDWNPSHFLDTAEMTAALALGYDWLHGALSPEARTTIREAIVEKGLEISFPDPNWATTENNWNQVCHGGLTLGALAVFDEAPDLAKRVIARAVAKVPIAMKEYEPDGVYPEGPTYWVYGTSYNVLLIAALESALGSASGLDDRAGFMRSPHFYLHSAGPTGRFYNFADCREGAELSPAMHWFARRLNDPSLLWNERPLLEHAELKMDRMLPFLLLWPPLPGDVAAPAATAWHGGGSTPVALMRSGWNASATFAAVKGGSPGANHAHMDSGSFVLDQNGVRWAVDLGLQDYLSLESRGVDLWNRTQDSERWSVFRLNNFSHNTLVVDGQLQRVKGNAPMTAFQAGPEVSHAIVDLTPVYEGQLASVQRGLWLAGESVLVQDDITAPGREVSVRWGMVTRAEVTLDATKPGRAVLAQEGQELLMRVLAPAGARLAVVNIETPPAEHDAKNPGTHMIVFETTLQAGASQRLAVAFGTETDYALVPLHSW